MEDSVKMIEKVAILHGKVDAAHSRVDKMESFLASELKEIKVDLKDVIAHMNRGKGWAAATLLLSSMGGGIIAFVIGLFFKH